MAQVIEVVKDVAAVAGPQLASNVKDWFKVNAKAKAVDEAKKFGHKLEDVAESTALAVVSEVSRDVTLVSQYGKRKLSGAYQGFDTWRHKKARYVNPVDMNDEKPFSSVPVIFATATHTVAPLEQVLMRIPSKKSFGNITSFNKMYANRRRKRKRSRRKSVTKRGVKRLIAMNQSLSDWNRFVYSSANYWGILAPLVYGNAYRGDIEFFTRAQLEGNEYGTGKIDDVLESSTALLRPAVTENIKYAWRNIRVKFLWHNPMNEVVRATFWWCRAKEDSDSTPKTMWENGYNDDKNTGTEAFLANYHTYPTLYKGFRDYWKIVKKFETVFQPGETKIMYTRARRLSYTKSEGYHAYLNNLTHAMMVELKGVPTHQNDGMGASGLSVDYSPVGLDGIYEISMEGARSSVGAKNTEFYFDARPTVTAGVSLTNEATSVISTN